MNCLQDTGAFGNIDEDHRYPDRGTGIKQRDQTYRCCDDEKETYQRTGDEVTEHSQGIHDLIGHQGLDKEQTKYSPANIQVPDSLSAVLQCSLSGHSDVACSVQDYSHAPESVTRMNMNCVQDTEDLGNIYNDPLFRDGDVKQPDLAYRTCVDEEEIYRRTDDDVAENSPGISDLTDQQGLDEEHIPSSHDNRQTSDELSAVLQNSLSEQSDGVSSEHDYCHARESVNCVDVSCVQDTKDLENIDDHRYSDGDIQQPDVRLSCCGENEEMYLRIGEDVAELSPGISDLTDNQNLDEENIPISPKHRQTSDGLTIVLKRSLSENNDRACSIQDYSHAPESVIRTNVNTEDIDKIDNDLMVRDGDCKQSDLAYRFCGDEEETCQRTDDEVTYNSPGISDLTDHQDFDEEHNSISPNNRQTSDGLTVSLHRALSEHSDGACSIQDYSHTPESVKRVLLNCLQATEDFENIDYDPLLPAGDFKQPNLTYRVCDDEEESHQRTDDAIAEHLPGTSASSEQSTAAEVSKSSEISSEMSKKLDDLRSFGLSIGYPEDTVSKALDFVHEKTRYSDFTEILYSVADSQPSEKEGDVVDSDNETEEIEIVRGEDEVAIVETENDKIGKDIENAVEPESETSSDEDQTYVFGAWNGAQASEKSHPMGTGISDDYISSILTREEQIDFTHDMSEGGRQRHISKVLNQRQRARSSSPRFGEPPKSGQLCDKKYHHVNLSTPQLAKATPQTENGEEFRYIVIDGSNVAMAHGNGKCFSCKGLRICVDYFKQRGHKKITVFVPQWRTYQPSADHLILDQHILYELKEEDILVFTPSRRIGRKLVAAYDDRFVLDLAQAEDGIIVSNDQYRDLMQEKPDWKTLIEKRLLMFSFVGDRFMPPADPLGRNGPTLDEFLRKIKPDHPMQQRHMARQTHRRADQRQGSRRNIDQSPYTHGTNARYQNVNKKGANFRPKGNFGPPRDQGRFPARGQGQLINARTEGQTKSLYRDLTTIFPGPDQDECVRRVLADNLAEKDITKLTNYCMRDLF